MSSNIEKIKRVFVWVFIIGLSLIFIISFSIPGGGVGHQSVVVGEVDGKPIKTGRRSKFVWYYQQFIGDLQEKGIEVDDYFDHLSREWAFKTVVEQILIKDYAIKNRYAVSDEELLSAIKRNQFVDEEGLFRQEQYELFKKKGGNLEKSSLEKSTRDQLLIQWLLYTLFEFLPVSTSEVQAQSEASQYRKSLLVGYLNLSDRFEEVMDKDKVADYYRERQTNYGEESFEQVLAEVEADFINEYTSVLEEKLETKYDSILTEKRSEFAQNFVRTATSLDMRIFKTSPLGYFDEEVLGENSERIEQLSLPSFIKKAMVLSSGEVSFPIIFGDGVAVVMVTRVSMPSFNTNELDSFAVNKFKESLQKEKSKRLQKAFRVNLYKNADVVSKL